MFLTGYLRWLHFSPSCIYFIRIVTDVVRGTGVIGVTESLGISGWLDDVVA